jgi:hypothetical protein
MAWSTKSEIFLSRPEIKLSKSDGPGLEPKAKLPYCGEQLKPVYKLLYIPPSRHFRLSSFIFDSARYPHESHIFPQKTNVPRNPKSKSAPTLPNPILAAIVAEHRTKVAMHRIVIIAAVITIALTNSRLARAGPDECKEAIAGYNSALEEISNAMKRYSRCVSDSQGHDGCSSEFRRLKSSQSDLETAVSNYGSECE